jgi:hypothetical protein
VNYQTDEANCGSCGHKCLATATCEAGSCKYKSVVTYKVITTVPKISLAPVYQKPVMPGF